ncbi:transcriptional regulator [Ornithobacterium rhinotracheale]|uniref:transcriptional regulator n=1 Tax=Ornithobacterium rhinotracheale TaxID=28251 RepID=UPI00129CA8E7|nr:transcriptional regulator [Ornithobacterium rhinotracheale]MRJ09357.1 transcriptional regulator [Ornithobacterium rhinotracheale]UOH79002.1 transcriptional regulator [Ornithobacterium rhinotracheale]
METITKQKSKFKVGDEVLIAPQVTGEKEWIKGSIIKIDTNPFVGLVINVKTDNGSIFFEKKDMFKPLNQSSCTQ